MHALLAVLARRSLDALNPVTGKARSSIGRWLRSPSVAVIHARVARAGLRRARLLVATYFATAIAPTYACRALDVTALQSTPAIRQLTFVAIDLRSDSCWESSAADASERHPPWSTFKIPHLLIALETKAAHSPNALIAWDATKRPAASYWPAGWQQSQTLMTAFERSAAWYFQELVPKIGGSNYAKWLGNFSYGNQQVPPSRDDFWLGGPLAISAREQARFLACVATTGCGASPASVETLESASLSSDVGSGRIFAKTGSGPLTPGQFDGPFEGWYVGYVRSRDAQPMASFALYVQATSYRDLQSLRQQASVQLLRGLGLF
jgi:beta-lactamase class D